VVEGELPVPAVLFSVLVLSASNGYARLTCVYDEMQGAEKKNAGLFGWNGSEVPVFAVIH
jgi:hypothetical protein